MIFLKKKSLYFYSIELLSLMFFMIFSISLEYLPPNIRVYDINDKSIQFPYTKHEVISAFMLPLFNMGIPTIALLASAVINRFKNKRILVAILGLYFTISLAFLITNIFKSPVGRLRPDFLSRCNHDVSRNICTGEDHLIIEGRRSFPSGHASSTFAGMLFLALFLIKHFSIFDGSGRIYKFLIFLVPILIASLVAISRIVDYRHHWDDVLVGSLIGCASACSAYFYFYNLLFENNESFNHDRTNKQHINNDCCNRLV